MELANKRVVFLGDSITEGRGTTSESKIFHQIIKNKYHLDVACGCGIGGTRIAKNKVPTYSVLRHDLYFALRAQIMPKDMDIIVVFGGTNDYGHGDGLLGDIKSQDINTFNGALNNLILQLKNDYPNKPIVMLTPLHRINEMVENKLGYILKDYVDSIIEASKRHNIYLIDLFNELDLDPYNEKLVPDGLHPNDDGHVIIADFVGKKLCEL